MEGEEVEAIGLLLQTNSYFVFDKISERIRGFIFLLSLPNLIGLFFFLFQDIYAFG